MRIISSRSAEAEQHPPPDGANRNALPADVVEVFGQLFDRHAANLRRYLGSRVGPHVADDLVSQTYLAGFRRWRTFDASRGTPQAWLYGIATNQLRDHYRSETRYLAATMRAVGRDSAVNSDDADDRLDAATAVRRLVPDLLRLDPVDRDILLLNAWTGLTLAEIAVALDMPAGTVRSRLHRLRRELRAAAPHPDPPAPAGLPGMEAQVPVPQVSGELT